MKPVLIPSPVGTTRLYAVLGDPVAQVQAPQLMNEALVRAGVDAVMVAVHAPPRSLAAIVRGLQQIANLDGMLITIPHKFAVGGLVDRVSDAVALSGAANALRREHDGSWSAENFDGEGFVAGLRQQGHDPSGKRIALIGAGGAGAAIAVALTQAGVASIAITDLAVGKAQALVDRLQARSPGSARCAESPDLKQADIVIQATPVGLRAEDPLPFDVTQINAAAVVADIIMKPAVTPLLRAAQARGLSIHPGIHMLSPQVAMYCRYFGVTR